MSALSSEIHQSTHIHTTHTVLVVRSTVFLTRSSGSHRLCETPHVRRKRAGISMPCLAAMWLRLLAMEKSSLVSPEEVQFSQQFCHGFFVYLPAATVVVLAEDSRLECALLKCFTFVASLFPFLFPATQG